MTIGCVLLLFCVRSIVFIILFVTLPVGELKVFIKVFTPTIKFTTLLSLSLLAVISNYAECIAMADNDKCILIIRLHCPLFLLYDNYFCYI